MDRVMQKLVPAIARKTASPAKKNRCVVLHDVAWDSYVAIREALRDQNVFLTYDRGTLEIMTLSFEHERYKNKWCLLVQILARHFKRKCDSCGSFTNQREDLEQGLEPDQCFYASNLAKVLGKKRINLSVDPPPDLAIEVDITHSSVDRIPIYQRLAVPELWHVTATSSRVLLLDDNQYRESATSGIFPDIKVADLVPWAELGLEQGEQVMWDKVESWLKKHWPRTKRPRNS